MGDGTRTHRIEMWDGKDRVLEEVNEPALQKYFTLHPRDLAEIALCRGATNRLGFAVQLCVLR
jgi:Domain of unknown function (DUF4158)